MPLKPKVKRMSTDSKRVKRTEAQMIESVSGDPLSQAVYVKDRITKLEDKIADMMKICSPEALELVLKGREHLSRYLP